MKNDLPNSTTAQNTSTQTTATSQSDTGPSTSQGSYTIFQGECRLHTGELRQTLTYLKTYQPEGALVFDDHKGKWTDFDLRGTLDDVLNRELPTTAEKSGPGRPKLGVTAREVTLLPRHWEWLENQQGGISATLRRLIDDARKRDPEGEQVRHAQAATDRFLLTMAGQLPGYEEATRALYQRDQATFMAQSQTWPEHIRTHALSLAAPAFESTGQKE